MSHGVSFAADWQKEWHIQLSDAPISDRATWSSHINPTHQQEQRDQPVRECGKLTDCFGRADAEAVNMSVKHGDISRVLL